MKLYFSLLFMFVASGQGQNPGVAIRINKYVLNAGISEIQGKVKKGIEKYLTKLPPFSHLDVDSCNLKNIKITKFNPEDISLKTEEPEMIGVSFKGVEISIETKWNCTLPVGGTYSGDASVNTKKTALRQTLNFDRPVNQRPKITFGECSFEIGNFNIDLSNVNCWQWMVNSILFFMKTTIKKTISEQVCPGIKKYLQKYLELVDLPLTDIFVPLPDVNVNIGLTKNPEISDSGIAVYFDGKCYHSKLNPQQKFNFSSTTLPSFPQSKLIVQMIMSEYLLNTYLVSLWQANKYKVKFTEEQVLNYVSVAAMDISTIEEAISSLNHNKNRTIALYLEAPSPFHISINPEGISLRGNISLKVESLKSSNVGETVLSLNIIFISDVKASIKNSILYLNLDSFDAEAIGPGKFSDIFNSYVKEHGQPLIKQLNDGVLVNRFEFPSFYEFKIIDANMAYFQNAVAIEGSIN